MHWGQVLGGMRNLATKITPAEPMVEQEGFLSSCCRHMSPGARAAKGPRLPPEAAAEDGPVGHSWAGG